jgi:hypothetical protein
MLAKSMYLTFMMGVCFCFINCESLGTNTFSQNAEHNEGYGFFKYYNDDGSLAWNTFYSKWREVPDSYFIYFDYTDSLESEADEMLWKVVEKDDVRYSYEKGYSRLRITFSPWNYTDAKEIGWIPIGSKKYNFDDAISRWNFMLNNYF